MKIALASSRELPPHECDDDHLVDAFARLGHEARYEVWSDPDVPWQSYDLCLPRRTWDYASVHRDFLRWVEDVKDRTRLLNPAGMVRWNSDKAYLLELRGKGVPLAPTRPILAREAAALPEILSECGWEEAFLKPCIGQTSMGTLRFAPDAAGIERARALLGNHAADDRFLLQPFLPSVLEQGEVSLIFVEGRLTHAVRKVPVPGDYRVQDDFGASDAPCRAARDELVVALDALAHIPDPLYARVDLLRLADGRPVLNELELIEPCLFFRHAPQAAAELATAALKRLEHIPPRSLRRG